MLPSPPISPVTLPPPVPPIRQRPVSMILPSKMKAKQWEPKTKPGQIIAFSISLDGLCELFLDNPALVGSLRRMRFNKYLGVVHETSIYDPLGVVADGLHRFSRPPPEDLAVTLIGPGPTPELPSVGIPICSASSQISSNNPSSSLHLMEPTALPFTPAFAYLHKPIRLISHDVHVSIGGSDDRGSSLSPGSQTRLADAVWQTAGSWEASAPTSGLDVSLERPTTLANINVLVDVWTEFDHSSSFADPSSLQNELTQIQQTIARFYSLPCQTSINGDSSADEEPNLQPSTSDAPAPGEPGSMYVLGLSAAITAGVFWTRYFRR